LFQAGLETFILQPGEGIEQIALPPHLGRSRRTRARASGKGRAGRGSKHTDRADGIFNIPDVSSDNQKYFITSSQIYL